MQCFVCSVQLDGDPSFVQHHLNACLDRQGSSRPAPPSARLPPLDTASFTPSPAPLRPSSPSHSTPLSPNSEQFRLDAALALALAYEQQGQSNGRSSSRAKSPVFSVATTADESLHCPCCEARWSDLGVAPPAAAEDPQVEGKRRKHVQKCLEGRERLFKETAGAGVGLHGEWEDDGGGGYHEAGEQAGGVEWTGGVGGKGEVKGTAGLLPLIRTALIRSHASSHGRTQVAYLASAGVEHIATKFVDWGWGCGYKNAQMLFSALRHLPCYAELFADSSTAACRSSLPLRSSSSGAAQKTLAPIPTIREWQELIEKAWSAGHDPPGRTHFNGKLIGSRRWIGTTEVYTALTWMGVRATIVDFPKVDGGQGTHQALVHWIIDYFSTTPTTTTAPSPATTFSASAPKNAFSLLTSGSPVHTSTPRKQPLYLQHAGHSRTVVGVEVMKGAEAGGGGKVKGRGGEGDMWLLVFDPGKPIPQDLKRAASSHSSASTLEHDPPSCSDEHSPFKKLKSTLSSSPSSTKPGGFGRRGGKKEEEIKFGEVLKVVRVNMKDLKKRDEYQILFVEETAPPLTSQEKAARKLVKARVATPFSASSTSSASAGSTPRVA